MDEINLKDRIRLNKFSFLNDTIIMYYHTQFKERQNRSERKSHKYERITEITEIPGVYL